MPRHRAGPTPHALSAPEPAAGEGSESDGVGDDADVAADRRESFREAAM